MPNFEETPAGIEYLKDLKNEQVNNILKYTTRFEEVTGQGADYREVAKKIDNLKMDFMRTHPDFRAAEVNLYFHMIFGAMTLSPEIYTEKLRTEEKVESARTQQMMVHKLIWGIYGDNDEPTRARIYHQWRNLELLSQTKMGQQINLSAMLSGIRSQASIIQALIDEGFQVVLPNYVTQPGGYSQVEDWDVRRGIDFLAIPPDEDRLLLLNAKGTINATAVEVVNQTREENLPNNILAYLPGQATIARAEIRIPSHTTHRVVPVLPETSANYRYALSGAILLKGLDYADIIDRLQELK